MAMFLGLVLPAVTFYPAAVAQADRTRRQVVETQLAPQAIRQRDEVQATVRRAMTQVDAVPGLTDLVLSQPPPAAGQVPTEYAFLVWSKTDLAANRLTSAIELYAEGGGLTSRFALNLPEYTQAQQRWQEAGCAWEVFEEVSPFGSEERRLLHAGRGLCVGEGSGDADGRHGRHPRDARLRLPALHHLAEPVRRALPEPAVVRRREHAGPRRGIRRLRLEPHSHLRVEPDDVDHRHGHVPARLRVTHAVLDDAGLRGPARPCLPGQRSRRHLRAGLPGHRPRSATWSPSPNSSRWPAPSSCC